MMTLQELAALRVAFKRENAEEYIKEWIKEWKKESSKSILLDQVKAGIPREFHVTLYRTEDDNYNELWKVVGENKYFCRNVYHGMATWYHVCDPLGYCELDYACKNNYVFIVCSSDGTMLFASSNIDARFPTLEETCLMEWNRIKDGVPHTPENTEMDFYAQAFGVGTVLDINNWLLSYKDPELYGDEAKTYDENWIYCRSDEIKREILSSFDYLGGNYAIYKVTYKHRICGKIYSEYCAGKDKMDEYDNWIKVFASYHTNEIGTMYSEREAKKIVMEFLKQEYPIENKFKKPICVIMQSCVGSYEKVINYSEAADYLIERNYNRKYIAELIEKEKKKHTFYYHGDPQIEVDYPNYMKASDYSWL